MSLTIVTLVFTLVCVMSTTEAIKPVAGGMTPEHACLFYCYQCYADQRTKMMSCANVYCPVAARTGHDFEELINGNDCSIDAAPKRASRLNFFQ
ncbi:hypothetical protein Ahia01_000416800 [Argonauta hians]